MANDGNNWDYDIAVKHADLAIPSVFVAIVKRQQSETVAALLKQAMNIETMSWSEYAAQHGVTFAACDGSENEDDVGELRLAKIAALGSQRGIVAPPHLHGARSITLRRYPSKSSEAWRVESERGEWYVSYKDIVKAWAQ